MTHALTGLDPAFRATVEATLEACAARGHVLRVYCGVRSPQEQARLWRRSRTTREVREVVDRLRLAGAPYLARVLWDVGPQPTGPWATNAVPGASWHQHALAVDACPWDGARYHWGDMDGLRAWAWEAERHGLTSLGLTMGRDWYHVQARPEGSPLAWAGSWAELDRLTRERWAPSREGTPVGPEGEL